MQEANVNHRAFALIDPHAAKPDADSTACTPLIRRDESSRAVRVSRAGPCHHETNAFAIAASFATVFILRAVPAFAAGIFSLESAMPSP